VKIYFEKENKTEEYQLDEKKTLKDILKEKDISIDSIILVKNNQICLEDESVSNEDEIKILSVVSGG
jgi:sulfur carrier protein ThiS